MKIDKKWNILNNFQLNSTEQIEKLITILLENRGITSKKDVSQFLNPKIEDVTIESVEIDKKNLAKTIKRIQKAILEKDEIVVYGDYDVDGITGTAILWETLNNLGAKVMPYIPHRVDEGYGLSLKGLQNIKDQMPNSKLIITVDNGIVANEAVDFANQNNIEVIITDHHTPPVGGTEKLPNAFSIVHTTKLCGAGVAWMLSQNLKSIISNLKITNQNSKTIVIPAKAGIQKKVDSRIGSENDKYDHLDLVALATVADLVPLTGANRILLSMGLPYLQKTKRLGLLELFKEAAIDPNGIGVYEIGHVIGPRLNAMGRLESAMDSLRLLCTKNPKRARLLAGQLGITNRDRQSVTKARALHAIESVKRQALSVKNIILVADAAYEEGIIGLVAGKLVEEFYRPSIVISVGEKVSKASARSVAGFNIIEFIRGFSHLLINAGGHPMAAGFTVETEKIALLQGELEKVAQSLLTVEHLTPLLKIDCELNFSLISQNLFFTLQKLSPFGMGNPQPLFVSRGVEVENLKIIGKDKNHLKLLLSSSVIARSEATRQSPSERSPRPQFLRARDDNASIEAIAFNMADKAQHIKAGDKVDVVYALDENEWNGKKTLQLKIRDIKPS